MRPPRIAVVGHYTYFLNHFPEGWRNSENILCLDVDEKDYSFLIAASNFQPDITLFYRPELYPASYLSMIKGQRIAMLSEPVPELRDGHVVESSETSLRLDVYQGMQWHLYDRAYYYDETKASMIKALGWPVTGFRPLPIDTSVFRPGSSFRPVDVCFIGKATRHRIKQFDFLRSAPIKFVWINHGVSGASLAALFRRSKVILNVHADGLPAIEPRIWLAAACGCVVLTERMPCGNAALERQVIQFDGMLDEETVHRAMNRYNEIKSICRTYDGSNLSCMKFIEEQLSICSDGPRLS